MGYVVSLTGYRPSPRYDETPWHEARISEGEGESGPWTQLEVILLDPVDADPASPAARSFTTAMATAPEGLWYKVVFADADGNTQESDPAYNGGDLAPVPRPDQLREWSRADWIGLGYPAPGPGELDPLIVLIDRAVPELQSITGLSLASLSLSDDRVPLIQKAIQRMVEWEAGASQPDVIETAADYDLIGSFSVGSYSETRRSGVMRGVYHPWPTLNRLLGLIIYFSTGGRADEAPEVGVPDPDWDVGKEILELPSTGGPVAFPRYWQGWGR